MWGCFLLSILMLSEIFSAGFLEPWGAIPFLSIALEGSQLAFFVPNINSLRSRTRMTVVLKAHVPYWRFLLCFCLLQEIGFISLVLLIAFLQILNMRPSVNILTEIFTENMLYQKPIDTPFLVNYCFCKALMPGNCGHCLLVLVFTKLH